MGTNYYRLRPPITCLRLLEGPGYNRLSVWANHGLSGTLLIPRDSTWSMIQCFIDRDNMPALHTSWGGSERGSVVTVWDTHLDDNVMVASEYCELITVGQVKARDGAKRKDGTPTELWGYEKEQDG